LGAAFRGSLVPRSTATEHRRSGPHWPAILVPSAAAANTAHLDEAKRVAERLTGPYIAQQIKRLQEAAAADPELAIGTAKEFLESICKTILTEREAPPSKNEDLPAFVRATVRSLAIVPSELSSQVQLEKTVTVLLNNLGSIGHQLAELRNQFGTGHGRSTDYVGLPARHATLAIGAAATLAVFLYESHEATPP
ncbi:MAG: abortive infection family protein, partial [Bryobacteraceae bacterium]